MTEEEQSEEVQPEKIEYEIAEYKPGSIHATGKEPGKFDVAGWIILKSWANNSVIRSSMIWLAIVPVAIVILQKADNSFQILGTNPQLTINLSLPFSWIVLYFAGIFGFVGRVILLYFCPNCIRDYPTFSEFIDRGNDEASVIDQAIQIASDEIKYKCIEGKLDASKFLFIVLTKFGYQLGHNPMTTAGKYLDLTPYLGESFVLLDVKRFTEILRKKMHPNNLRRLFNTETSRRLIQRDRSEIGNDLSLRAGYKSLIAGGSLAFFKWRLCCFFSLLISSVCYFWVFGESFIKVISHLYSA